MTNKEFVQSIYPQAYCLYARWEKITPYIIWCTNYEQYIHHMTEYCKTENEAWLEAAKKIQEKLIQKLER